MGYFAKAMAELGYDDALVAAAAPERVGKFAGLPQRTEDAPRLVIVRKVDDQMSMDGLLAVAKRIAAGDETAAGGCSRADFYAAMQKCATAIRKSNETEAQAFARFVRDFDSGKLMMAAHKAASGADFAGNKPMAADDFPPTTLPMQLLHNLASEKRKERPELSEAQAFGRAMESPLGRKLWAAHKDLAA